MKKIFGSSWRTSLTGYITAIGAVVIPIIQDDGFDIHKQWKSLLVAVSIAVYSRLSKDSDGMTKQENITVAKEATDGAIPPAEKQ